ncbi:MAG: LytTR family transcriptional regulator [Oscillospiraceae bacterium]|nr:LytTR family transcriptional regulator [Oscillospiraceae bacterium]
MKVRIELQKDLNEPYAVIYTGRIDNEVSELAARLGESQKDNFFVLRQDEKYVVVKPQEIYMARFEENQVVLYGRGETYTSKLRLYEIENQLGSDFLRISKTTLVNLKQIDSVESSFGGTMALKLKNGGKDYISRKYLPAFKKYLGI